MVPGLCGIRHGLRDLKKLKKFCEEKDLTLARRFSEEDFFRFRRWLVEQEYAAKTVGAALILTKQVFKWTWRQHILRDYSLASASFSKAKAGPQPCFTTDQVDTLIEAGQGEEKAALALMGYGGLRIGEVEQAALGGPPREGRQTHDAPHPPRWLYGNHQGQG